MVGLRREYRSKGGGREQLRMDYQDANGKSGRVERGREKKKAKIIHCLDSLVEKTWINSAQSRGQVTKLRKTSTEGSNSYSYQ